MKNSRDLLVKELVKDEILDAGAKYEKLYSNILKTDGSLRLKFFNVTSQNIKSIVKKIQAQHLGMVDIVKSPSNMGVKSIVIYVNKENIV